MADSDEPRLGFIRNVHTETPKAELKALVKLGKEYTFQNEGQQISMMVYDFRPKEIKNTNETSIEKTLVNFYFMGFAQSDADRPNDLIGGIIKKSQQEKRLLLVPRFKELPKTSNIEDEVLIKTLTGSNDLTASLEKDGIKFDFAKQDVTLYGFSDGNRILVQMADKIDEIPQIARVDGGVSKRVMHSLSPTGIIYEAPPTKTPTGEFHVKGFNEQVGWIVAEETRLRLNYLIEDTTTGLTEKGFNRIEDPKEVKDSKSILDTAKAVLKLWTFSEGRKMFVEQFNESVENNLGRLFDVLQRAATSKQRLSYEELGTISKAELLLIGLASMKAVKEQFAHAEARLDECNNLSTFEIIAKWPKEDLIVPEKAYGWTFKKILFDISQNENLESVWSKVLPEVSSRMIEAIKSGDNAILGKLFMENINSLDYLLFPNAKSVQIEFVGETGSLDASHLIPMTSSSKVI